MRHSGSALCTSQHQAFRSNGNAQQQRRPHHQLARAERRTVESPKAPGSESDFTGLPKNKNDIPVTTPASSHQMEVRCGVCCCTLVTPCAALTGMLDRRVGWLYVDFEGLSPHSNCPRLVSTYMT